MQHRFPEAAHRKSTLAVGLCEPKPVTSVSLLSCRSSSIVNTGERLTIDLQVDALSRLPRRRVTDTALLDFSLRLNFRQFRSGTGSTVCVRIVVSPSWRPDVFAVNVMCPVCLDGRTTTRARPPSSLRVLPW